jgi:large subunit ribosomal protein L17
MRHRRKDKILSRKAGPKKALLRGLVSNLIIYEKITTTLAKAKQARRLAEKVITWGKKGDLAGRRQILKIVYSPNLAKKVIEVLAPKYKERKGGYTRVTKLNRRQGDAAEMARIEFI